MRRARAPSYRCQRLYARPCSSQIRIRVCSPSHLQRLAQEHETEARGTSRSRILLHRSQRQDEMFLLRRWPERLGESRHTMGTTRSVVRPMCVCAACQRQRLCSESDIGGLRGARRERGHERAQTRTRDHDIVHQRRLRHFGRLKIVQNMLRRGAECGVRALRARSGVREVRDVDQQVPHVPADFHERGAAVLLVRAGAGSVVTSLGGPDFWSTWIQDHPGCVDPLGQFG